MTRFNHNSLPDVGFRFARMLLLLSLIFLPFLAFVDYQNGYVLPSFAKCVVILVCLFAFYLSKNEKNQRLIRLGVAFSLLTMSIVGAWTKLDTFSGLIWVPVLPLLFCFLVGIRSGATFSCMYLSAYLLSYGVFESVHGVTPVEFKIWATSVAAFIFVLIVTILFQKETYRFEKHLMDAADFDFLTQIYNRRGFMPRIEGEIERVNRYGGNLSIIIADIDNFKKVNDTYGHTVGDTLLKDFSDLIVQLTRTNDVVARWGGEEFIILASGTALNECLELAEKLRFHIEKSQLLPRGQVTSSFGVAQYQGGEPLHSFLDRGDKCLFQAKHSGKNKVVVDNTVRLAPAGHAAVMYS